MTKADLLKKIAESAPLHGKADKELWLAIYGVAYEQGKREGFQEGFEKGMHSAVQVQEMVQKSLGLR